MAIVVGGKNIIPIETRTEATTKSITRNGKNTTNPILKAVLSSDNIKDGIKQLYADKDRLEQVIINILENANKYAYEDTPIIANLFRRGNKAIISVTNNADYIPPEKINSLFEKFTRMDDKTTRTTRGTGLGLFIVKGLVEAMGGKIKLHSYDDFGFVAEMRFNIYDESGNWTCKTNY